MANDGKIYITISDRRFGKNKAEADEQNKIDKQKEEKEKRNPLAEFAEHKFFNFIQAEAKQSIDYTLSNIGNFTGDYVTQQHVQNAMSIASVLSNIAMAAYAGSKFGPWGAAIGAGVVIAGTAITKTQELFLGYSQNNLQNKQIEQLRTRAGLNSSNNGSRGTEY